jgi:hypothetical protein
MSREQLHYQRCCLVLPPIFILMRYEGIYLALSHGIYTGIYHPSFNGIYYGIYHGINHGIYHDLTDTYHLTLPSLHWTACSHLQVLSHPVCYCQCVCCGQCDAAASATRQGCMQSISSAPSPTPDTVSLMQSISTSASSVWSNNCTVIAETSVFVAVITVCVLAAEEKLEVA